MYVSAICLDRAHKHIPRNVDGQNRRNHKEPIDNGHIQRLQYWGRDEIRDSGERVVAVSPKDTSHKTMNAKIQGKCVEKNIAKLR